MTRAKGIDVSKYDLTFDPSQATEPIDFVVQRASYRTTQDEGFNTIYEGVKNVPIRLAYHYLNSDTGWQAQADKFLSVVAGKGFHAYVCDFEQSFNTLSQSFAKQAWDFCAYVVKQTGKRCLIYTNFYHYKDYLIPSQATYNINWNVADLWIAQYPDDTPPITTDVDNTNPVLPTGRTGWSLWQYASKGDGTAHGVGRPTACDLDVFNGTVADMRTWLGIAEPVPETQATVSFVLDIDGAKYQALDVPLTKVT